MSSIMEDDERRSLDSFPYEDHQHDNEEYGDNSVMTSGSNRVGVDPMIRHNQSKTLSERFSLLCSHQPSITSTTNCTMKEPLVEEIARVSFKNYIIRIFTDPPPSSKRLPQRFYFEPLVQLDPQSIECESNELFNQNLVRFKIKMWDSEIQSKVLERLRSLPSLESIKIQRDDVHVMPYEEVQLVAKQGDFVKSIKMPDEATSYRRLCKNLDCRFECYFPTEAAAVAESLKKNPDAILLNWKLALECRGLELVENSSTAGIANRPTWIFNVSTLPCEPEEGETTFRDLLDTLLPRLAGCEQEIQDLKTMITTTNSASNNTSISIRELQQKMSTMTNQVKSLLSTQEHHADAIKSLQMGERKQNIGLAVPVFSVENCVNPTPAKKAISFGFSNFLIDTEADHGQFDLSSGIFTAKTKGKYQLEFKAFAFFDSDSKNHRVQLRVNGNTRVNSENYSKRDISGYQAVVISALLPLEMGDKVGVYPESGKLYQDDAHKFQFYGTLIE